MSETLTDRIYEAAFVPELWPQVLDDMSALSQSVGGVVFASGARHASRWSASASVHDIFTAYVQDPAAPPARAHLKSYAGFQREVDVMARSELARDPLQGWLRAKGLGWHVGTVIPMPSGETVIVSLERRYSEGPHPDAVLAILDALRPHLARTTLIAARLGLERARSAVSTLEAIGLPAAVLSGTGRILAANALLDKVAGVLPAAHGRLLLADAAADRLLRETTESIGNSALPRSIPLPASPSRTAAIVHVLPLRGAAHDIMGGETLVAITPVNMTADVPDTVLLQGLFDLTPKEARLAASLAGGRSLKQAAAEQGIQVSTARSYVEGILRKTGTHQQSQLVALLKTARSVQPP